MWSDFPLCHSAVLLSGGQGHSYFRRLSAPRVGGVGLVSSPGGGLDIVAVLDGSGSMSWAENGHGGGWKWTTALEASAVIVNALCVASEMECTMSCYQAGPTRARRVMATRLDRS